VSTTRSTPWRPGALVVLTAYLALGVITLRPEWLGAELELRRVVWLSSGVALAAVLRMGIGIWPMVALAELAVTLITGSSLLHAVGTAVGNTVEVALAWALLRAAGLNPDLRRWSDIAALVVLAAGVAALAGSAISTLSLLAFEGMPPSAFMRVWVLWWLTHANGMILGAPFLLTFGAPLPRWSPARRGEAVLLAALILAMGMLVFIGPLENQGRQLLYAPFPLLLWAAFRFGMFGAATANLALSAIAMIATASDQGPFVAATPNESLFQLWIFVAVNTITALIVAGMVDERRHTARALARSEAHLRSVVDSTADAVIALDARARVSFTNRRFADLWDPGGESPPRGRLAADDPRVRRLMGGVGVDTLSALVGSHRTVLDEVRLEDGEVFERYSAPLVREGKVTGRIWSFRDLTERRRAEDERQRLEQQVQHAQKLESLGVLAGGIAHDFNNLLVAIMGNADLAEAALEPGHPACDPVAEVIRASQRAADLCQQMLAYAGKGRVAVGPVDLNDVVQEMGELLGVSISKGALLQTELSPGLPRVRGDVVQLRQVVLNLLTNASDALASGEGEIRMATYAADPTTFDESASVLDERPVAPRLVALDVTDSGEGMDEGTRTRIFEPFFSTKARGRGLGLAAVLGIVRGHRGTLELWSRPGSGTRVRILLPGLDPRAPSEVAPPPEPLIPALPEGRLSGTVLVVDDEESVRKVASRMLRQSGLEVIEAADGREGLERFRDAAGRVDVVLLDLTMPRMGGAEAARELRLLDPDVRIVLSTGYSDMAASAAGAGGLPVLRKPYRRGALLARIREVLDHPGGALRPDPPS
jgi:signal transduction histidine kinase/CheY-like chemotaxis protein